MADQIVAFFEPTLQKDKVKVVAERHYRLVSASGLDPCVPVINSAALPDICDRS